MKTRGKIGIFLTVVGILASLALIGTNQTTQLNQEEEKTSISVSPKIQDEVTKETVKVESKPEVKIESEPKPVEPEPEKIEPEPVESESEKPETIQTEPVKVEPVKTEPVQPEKEQEKVEPYIVCLGKEDCIRGKVTKINDGDTIKIDGISVRFALTSTPEIRDSGGIEARDYIEKICPVGSDAVADEDDGQPDGSYERTVAKIYCNGYILNESILEEGLGEISTNFCSKSEFASEPWAIKFGCR